MGKKLKLQDKPYVILDTETTGLHPYENEIIELYMYKPKTGEEFHTYIKPERLETASSKALEINGYAKDSSKWDEAPLFDEVVLIIESFMEGHVVVGHNVQFDLNMLKGAVSRCEYKDLVRMPYHCVDTVTLAQEHLVPLGLTSVSLDKIRVFLGWSKENAHTAKKDVQDTNKLFQLLFRMPLHRKLKLKLQTKLGL